MPPSILDTHIQFLKGVGPKRADLLNKEVKIYTYADLLEYFPFRYIDRSRIYKINEITSAISYVQIRGKLMGFSTIGHGRGKRLVAQLKDETGIMELVWFKGAQWISKSLQQNTEYIVFGKPNLFRGKLSIPHPEIDPLETFDKMQTSSLQGVYSSTDKLAVKGLNSRGFLRLQKELIKILGGEIEDSFSIEFRQKLNLISREEALINIHHPQSPDLLRKAQYRLKFEELFYIQLRLLMAMGIRKNKLNGIPLVNAGKLFNQFYKELLPFSLTNAQKRVVKEIHGDLKSGTQMNRLLQGDVGSGKTIVALLSLLIAVGNSFQGCLMAPTEILANQHFNSLGKLSKGLNIKLALLTGSTKAKDKSLLLNDLIEGKIDVLIGTHALIEDSVKFKYLGLVIIDEQHRFGVEQRAKLWAKNKQTPPHVLVMTATPIPRTLAMTLYGDLDSSVIDELPPGRQHIKTAHRYDSARLRVFGFIKEQILEGRQIYIVYPLIEESQKMDYKDLMDGYESVVRAFPPPDYQTSILHGKMDAGSKEFEMKRFVKGETQIMVATNVIEVGVDVPNATAIIIESAERFGLSQLHQMRGRVGRGEYQSYCILMTGNKLTNEARLRMETMVKTNDGFEIADADMKLRGPGDLEGTQQSGILDLRIADLVQDVQILEHSRTVAEDILKKDPNLELPSFSGLLKGLADKFKNKKDWSRIA